MSGTVDSGTADRVGEPAQRHFFATANEIDTMAADGTGIARITHDPRVDIYPRGSPTGTEIAVASNRDSGTESIDLYVITLATEQVCLKRGNRRVHPVAGRRRVPEPHPRQERR